MVNGHLSSAKTDFGPGECKFLVGRTVVSILRMIIPTEGSKNSFIFKRDYAGINVLHLYLNSCIIYMKKDKRLFLFIDRNRFRVINIQLGCLNVIFYAFCI